MIDLTWGPRPRGLVQATQRRRVSRRMLIVNGLLLAGVVLVGVVGAIAGAQSGTAAPAAPAAAPIATAAPAQAAGSPFGSMLSGTAGLDLFDLASKTLLVVGLLFLTLKALRRLQSGSARTGDGIAIIESRTIAPKTSVHVISVRGRELVIGLSPAGIVTLAELDDTSVSTSSWAASAAHHRTDSLS